MKSIISRQTQRKANKIISVHERGEKGVREVYAGSSMSSTEERKAQDRLCVRDAAVLTVKNRGYRIFYGLRHKRHAIHLCDAFFWVPRSRLSVKSEAFIVRFLSVLFCDFKRRLRDLKRDKKISRGRKGVTLGRATFFDNCLTED